MRIAIALVLFILAGFSSLGADGVHVNVFTILLAVVGLSIFMDHFARRGSKPRLLVKPASICDALPLVAVGVGLNGPAPTPRSAPVRWESAPRAASAPPASVRRIVGGKVRTLQASCRIFWRQLRRGFSYSEGSPRASDPWRLSS